MVITKYISAIVCVLLVCLSPACRHSADSSNTTIPPAITNTTDVKGYHLLSKVCGIWDGPVTSTTGLGSYPEWIVDFRPISSAQVSAKNELDTLNDIFMSFFIVYHQGEYKLAFRNGGSFAGMKRVSYMVTDSVSENSSLYYYRFIDFVQGDKRAIAEVIFKNDSMILRSFTNKNNTLPAPVIHMEWRARLQDSTSCSAARVALNFPQKAMVKDFSSTFSQVTESIYYSLASDPYPESAQPYLGQASLSYTALSSFTLDTHRNVFLFVTTQPLISGFSFNAANMKYRSRYVILSAGHPSFTFNYMHPGSYYLYSFYDADGNGALSSGDYVSTANTSFTLSALGTATTTAQMNFQMP